MALGLIAFVTGCAKTGLQGLVPEGGVILCDDAPLEGAIISFFPSSETGRTAVGRSDSAGKFILTTLIANDGAYPDSYKIAVIKVSEPTGETLVLSDGDEHGRENTLNMRSSRASKDTKKFLLPQKYSVPAASGLSINLSEKGDKNMKLEISSNN